MSCRRTTPKGSCKIIFSNKYHARALLGSALFNLKRQYLVSKKSKNRQIYVMKINTKKIIKKIKKIAKKV